VVVLHHQLIGAPWRTRKKPVAHRTHVLARLVDSGAELILGGHIHPSAVSARPEFEVIAATRTASSCRSHRLGQPRPRRLGEARGCASPPRPTRHQADTYDLARRRLGLTAERRFARAKPLASAGEAIAQRRDLLVVEHARTVQCRSRSSVTRLRIAAGAAVVAAPQRVGIEARLAQALAVLLDADASLRNFSASGPKTGRFCTNTR
jgi:hypothetical protein